MPSTDTLCGLSWLGHPKFLQKYATTKSFIVVYGILGTFQAMGYIYFMMTLQTVETRFKIPSQTTGVILSGNEVSQILLSVVLAYFGGQRNRPRFIAWGVICCSISCFILALPHFIFGAGEDALRVTKEWLESSNRTSIRVENSTADHLFRKSNRLCMLDSLEKECNGEIESILPLVLIFISQFVLGVGNTLYYALGQTYLDDNTKKTNTPLLLSYAFSLRTLGPSVGFVLGFVCLKMFIDPTKTPMIDSSDPRWMGAWWLGWCFLGVALLFCAMLIGLFPKDLPKRKPLLTDNRNSVATPKVLKSQHHNLFEEQLPLRRPSNAGVEFVESTTEIPTLAQLPAAMMRLFKNKVLMFNSISACFYILGASVYFTFMSKYMEVQFHKNAADAVIITGPITVFGIVIGFLGSGYVISKKKPTPSKLLMWNVMVGVFFMIGELSYLGMSCPDDYATSALQNGKLNLTSHCNRDCYCSTFAYTPVCMEETRETFFNPCIAGCNKYSKEKKLYYECECARPFFPPTTERSEFFTSSIDFVPTLPSSLSGSSSSLAEESSTATSTTTLPSSSTTTKVVLSNSTSFPTSETESTPMFAKIVEIDKTKIDIRGEYDEDYDNGEDYDDAKRINDPEQTETTDDDSGKFDETEASRRRKRSTKIDEDDTVWGKLTPGACLQGCAFGFWSFAIVSLIINCLGCSARIGNLLINYRCVSKQDKSVTQGLILMLISLFALIPGPILYGRIIDSTCLVWTEQCSGLRGNCQLYDQKKFRYYVNLTAFALTGVGVFFDFLVWKYGRDLDLYGEREEEMLKKQQRKNWSDKTTSS